jgi:hypothetical protein
LAALVVAHDVLVHAASQRWAVATPILGARLVENGSRSRLVGVPPPPDWMRQRIDGRTGYDPLRGSVAAEFRRP